MESALKMQSLSDRTNNCDECLRNISAQIESAAKEGKYKTFITYPIQISGYIQAILKTHGYKIRDYYETTDSTTIEVSWDYGDS
jgi:hypothetical protein